MRVWKFVIRGFLLTTLSLGLSFSLPAQESLSLREEIPLEKLAGVYHLPVEINNVMTLMFILDTGAADMSLPEEILISLMRSGTLSQEDFLPGKTYILADGNRVRSPRVLIHKVKIGNRVLRNVPATISEAGSPLLLGQSLLEKVGSYTFDSNRQRLVLHGDPAAPQGAMIPAPELPHGQVLTEHTQTLNDTEAVVSQFFQSVAREDFAESWNILSTYSQNTIVAMVAEEAQKPPDLIRQLFETNHRSVQNGFWSSFRESSRIPTLTVYATYRQTERNGPLATVKVRVGEEEIRFELYEEAGRWKLGLIESIERFRALK